MKIIFSRKGFDSAAGKCASPIFPDGRMLSLPIPNDRGPARYSDLNFFEICVGDLVACLKNGSKHRSAGTHLDPDINPDLIARPRGWRPAFGQVGAAQSHLANNNIAIGDIFLFFGWFRSVIQTPSGWTYKAEAQDLHVLFGWLQVGEILKVGRNVAPYRESHPWLQSHPHLHMSSYDDNTIYVASEALDLPGIRAEMSGGGAFKTLRPGLVLTAGGQSKRSVWALPEFFLPNGRTPLTYHKAPSRWKRAGNGQVHLETVGRGQEFVLDAAEYPEALPWVGSLISGE